MLITLEKDADPKRVRSALTDLGLWTTPLESRNANAVPALYINRHSAHIALERIEQLPGVACVRQEPSPHPRLDERAGRSVELPKHQLGGGAPPLLMTGPCSVESEAKIHRAAEMAKHCGAQLLRGGAYKPRTSPYSFTGHGRPALKWLRQAADTYGLGVVTEVMSESDVDAVAEVADLIQIGSRNMQNYALLRSVGACGKPVLLKRGMAAQIREWLLAGEHLLMAGASDVVFCERGVMSFDPSTRNLLDLGAVALLHHTLQLPVVVDPSHAIGRTDLIPALARAALAAGADGLLIEAHPDRGSAHSDGPQALNPEMLQQLREACGT